MQEDSSKEVSTKDEKADLALQVTKVDEEQGFTIDNNEMYQELSQLIKENPQEGENNDFSLFVIDVLNFEGEELKLLLLGINRLDEPITNISFNFTLGNTDGDFVWKDVPITMPEKEFGPIKVDHAIPVVLPVTEEQYEVINKTNKDNQVFEIENFTYDTD